MAKRKPKKNKSGDFIGDLSELLTSEMIDSFLGQMLGDSGLLPLEDEEEREALLKDKRSPLAKAQKLVYQAEDEFDPQRKRQLLEKALKASPDSADAFVLLGEIANSADESVALYRQAVAAGERALGEKMFAENGGEFWSIPITRPYMRARLALAMELWHTGQHEESIGHCQSLLKLDVDDNLKLHLLLASFLLQLGKDPELAELLDQFDDPSAEWLYQRAILIYRQEGDTGNARAILRAADQSNPHIASLMIDLGPLPDVPMNFPAPGSLEEATWYTGQNRAAWKTTAGAIPWLRKVLNPELIDYHEPPKPTRSKPRKIDWDQLHELPQSEDVWQVDHLNSPIAMPGEEYLFDSWLWLVAEVNAGRILDHELFDERLKAGETLNRLVKLMVSPANGDSSRPLRIETRLKSFAKAWAPKLEKVGIEVLCTQDLDVTDGFLDQMQSMVANSSQRGESAPDVETLQQIPYRPEAVWQIDHRQVPTWIQDEGNMIRPWMVLVANRSEGTVVGQQMGPAEISGAEIWRTLSVAMLRPNIGEAHRPSRIELTSPALRNILLPHLEALEIQIAVRDNLDQIDALFEDFGNHLAAKNSSPALLDVPGITLEQVGDYFAAAAEFFRRAPWRSVRSDSAVRIDCPKYRTGTWYAVVMGQSGITLGLAMYDNREMLDRIMRGGDRVEQGAREMSGLSLLYGEAFDMSPKDIEAAERYGWPLATTEAYPQAIWLDPGMAVRAPLTWELELLTGALRALPDFLEQKPKAPTTFHVPTVNGKLEFRLSWVYD